VRPQWQGIWERIVTAGAAVQCDDLVLGLRLLGLDGCINARREDVVQLRSPLVANLALIWL